MANEVLMKTMKEKGLPLWKVALELNICETTLQRWLRVELTGEKLEAVKAAIDQAAGKA